MTEDEALALLLDIDEPLARAMFRFRTECARIEQAWEQKRKPSTAARALMEFNAVKAIVEALGHTLPNDPLHMHEGKWWFWDETWANSHGPYDNRKAAKAALNVYCREVLGQP